MDIVRWMHQPTTLKSLSNLEFFYGKAYQDKKKNADIEQ
jgi:hypothetical protein